MNYEVLIVGAGPAGSTTAKHLAEKGIKVLLIDKDTFPRDKPCGGALTLRVLDRFPYVNSKKIIDSYAYKIDAYPQSLKFNISVKNNPALVFIRRKVFDHELVKQALDSGSEFIEGTRVSDIRITNNQAQITLADKSKIDAKLVLACDGVLSTVGKKTGLLPATRSVGICAFQELQTDTKILDRFFTSKRGILAHLQFQGIRGYGWVFPKKDHLNVGIGEIISLNHYTGEQKNIHKLYQQYLSYLKEKNLIPRGFGKGRVWGGLLPVHTMDKTYSDRLLLCGDAAGFVSPISGEGIYYAMASGELAAQVAAEALEINEYSGQFLSTYQNQWMKDFGRELQLLSRAGHGIWDRLETLFRLMKHDDDFSEMIMGVIYQGHSLEELRWKLILRYLILYAKDKMQKQR